MKKFLIKHRSEIAYAVALMICIFFFAHFVSLGRDYSSTVQAQAAERAETYASAQAQILEKQYAKMNAETEFYAEELANASGEDELHERFHTIASLARTKESTVAVLYFSGDTLYDEAGIPVTDCAEIEALKNAEKTVQSGIFQYGDHNMSVCTAANVTYPEPDTYTGSIRKVAVVYESETLFLSTAYEAAGKSVAEGLNKADFAFVCKGNGRIFDAVKADDVFSVKRNDLVQDVFADVLKDSAAEKEAKNALAGTELKSFAFRKGAEDYVLTVLPFGAERGNVTLVCAYKVSAVYDEGFALTQTIWSSLTGLACIIVLLAGTAVLWRRAAKKRIFALEMIDPFIGCATPKKFEKDVEGILKRHVSSSFAMASLKINNFGYFTEKFGDEQKLKLKKFVAQCVRGATHVGETFAYAGGGEFLLFMHLRDRQSFTERLNGIYLRISSFNAGEDYRVGVTFAVYELEENHRDGVKSMLEKLRSVRENASSQAKTLSINFYEDMLRKNYIRKAEIESRMENALKNSEFHLFYQPKYNLRNKTLDGSEILIRWYDPKIEGYRLPGEFLPVFEEDGFIVKIDRFVLYKACENIASRIAERRICYPVSVNVSRVSAIQPDFVDYYVRIRKKFGIKEGFITLEFTESFAYENYDYLFDIVHKLHEGGYHCSIDDFGTGYSSYNILKSIPMDEIKLDKFFLSKGVSEERDETLLSGVIGMVKKLGMKVTQEGVETKEDLLRLEALGCEVIQGYYFSKPLKYVDYLQFIETNFINRQQQ